MTYCCLLVLYRLVFGYFPSRCHEIISTGWGGGGWGCWKCPGSHREGIPLTLWDWSLAMKTVRTPPTPSRPSSPRVAPLRVRARVRMRGRSPRMRRGRDNLFATLRRNPPITSLRHLSSLCIHEFLCLQACDWLLMNKWRHYQSANATPTK